MAAPGCSSSTDEPRVLRALRAALKADFEVEVAASADSAMTLRGSGIIEPNLS